MGRVTRGYCTCSFGTVIPDGVTPGKEFIEVFLAISSEHGEWAKLITEHIEQSESDNDHVTIFWHIINSLSLRGERDPACAATRGVHSLTIPTTSPFIETTRIGNKFPDALAILRNDFMHNPTPAQIQNEASDDEDHPEVLITLQPNQQAHQLHQQPRNLAPQQQPQHPVPEQPVQFQLPATAVGGAPPAAVIQQPQQPFGMQEPAVVFGGAQQPPGVQQPVVIGGGGGSRGCNPKASTAAQRASAPPAAAQAAAASPSNSRGSAPSSTASVSVANSN